MIAGKPPVVMEIMIRYALIILIIQNIEFTIIPMTETLYLIFKSVSIGKGCYSLIFMNVRITDDHLLYV